MKFKAPLLVTLLASSCATYHPTIVPEKPFDAAVRGPSSSVAEENLQTSFDNLFNGANAENDFLDFLSRQKSMFARSEAYLKEFDNELDEAVASGKEVTFENSKAYKKLLVMRALSNRTQDKITYFYIKLTDVAYDKSQSASQRKLAKNILKKFKAELDSSAPISQLTYEDLKIHIAHALRLRLGFGNKSANSVDMPQSSFKSDEDRVQLIRANRAAIQATGKIEQAKADDLTSKIEDETDKVQLVDQPGREPQSEKKFYPSTGPNGNVMGMIFPKGVWALTYDDGPSPVHTPKIVQNLNDLGIKATFFWLAQNVLQYQSTVDLVKANGNALANHSWSHPQLPKLSTEGLNKEINKSTEVETKAYGQPVQFFRCPYGAGNSVQSIRQRIADLGMIHVFWNVDTLDWQDKDPDSIVERAKKQMIANGHGVVLFHDIHPQSVIASKKLVEWSKTYSQTPIRWVTLPEIVKEMNGE